MTYLIIILYLIGAFFNLAAVVGLLRMPDVYCRFHSSTKNLTMGSIPIVLGLVLQHGLDLFTVKALLTLALLFTLNPIASHALARGIYKAGVPLWEGSVCDHYEGTPAAQTKPTRSAPPALPLPEAVQRRNVEDSSHV